MAGIADFVTNNWGSIVPGKYLQLPNDFLVGKPDRATKELDLGANIHFTVGVRPEKVLELMALLTKAKNGPLSEKDLVNTKLEISNADIATRLVISSKTADHHVSAILAKMDVRSRSEAAAAARRLGV